MFGPKIIEQRQIAFHSQSPVPLMTRFDKTEIGKRRGECATDSKALGRVILTASSSASAH